MLGVASTQAALQHRSQVLLLTSSMTFPASNMSAMSVCVDEALAVAPSRLDATFTVARTRVATKFISVTFEFRFVTVLVAGSNVHSALKLPAAAGNFSAEWTFEPATRTVTNLNSKVTDMNFVATRVRATVNVASSREGATARASSTHTDIADMFEAGNVIDEVNNRTWDRCCNAAWVDATPNIYPDWLEITFKQPSDIDWINVFTLQDHPEKSDDPTL